MPLITTRKTLLLAFSVFGGGFLMQSCGSNTFDQADKKSTGEKAAKFLEADKPQDAIDLIEPAVEKDPTQYRLIALLGAAYAQRSGVETFKLIKNVIKTSESADTTGGVLGKMMGALPAATTANIAGLNKAVTLISSIPMAARKNADNFLLSIYLSASVALQAKSFDKDGDGKVTLEELKNLSEADAVNLINTLSSAADLAKLVGAQGATGGESTAASAKVQSVFDAIQKQPGATNSDKLKSYLANKQT